MLSDETIAYYDKAQKHLTKVIGNSLDKVFERFRTLYPLQNRLYDEATKSLMDSGIIADYGRNRRRATVNLVLYLGADQLIDELNKNNDQEDIDAIAEYMEVSFFHITLSSSGVHNPAADAALLAGLRSDDNNKKALAVVAVIYQVRCNDTHGQKVREQIQTNLLIPINNLLTTINKMLYDKLST